MWDVFERETGPSALPPVIRCLDFTVGVPGAGAHLRVPAPRRLGL